MPKNIKLELTMYFIVSAALAFGVSIAGWIYFYGALTNVQLWIGLASVLLIASLVVGYVAAKKLQSRLDTLHLAVLQLAKGNLSARIPVAGTDPFERIYRDFNDMAASLEQRVQLLQKLGEQNVLLEHKTNEEAIMEERRRLARDLHDTVSQQLFAIHMSASSLPKVLERGLDAAKPIMEQLVRMSYYAQKQMRGLIAQLRPLELEGKTLAEALDKWFPDFCRQNELQGSMDVRLKEPVSDGIERQLFLIIQEAMANIVKHASAKHVTLALSDTGHQYVLSIADDGTGFDKDAVASGSHGLSTMRERARLVGGDAEIWSRTGAGTRVRVSIPKFGQ